MRYLAKQAPLILWVTAVMVWTILGFYVGKDRGIAEGRSIAMKEALRTNPPSEELELVCAGLWIGEQNRKYWEKGNASKSK